MMTLTVSPSGERKIKQGICVLDERDLLSPKVEDCLVQLVNQTGSFLGQAYLSKQHKGIGWFVSRTKAPINHTFFESLFLKARKKRELIEQVKETTAYRLFNQDGDGFGGLSIDRYNDYALFSWYNSYVYSIKDDIIAAFQAVFPDIMGAYEKVRFKGPAKETAHLYGQEAPAECTVLENGVAYQIFLNEGLMTGIFLDQHEVRGMLADGFAAGKSVLNLFSYTAAFSVAAAMGGATDTTSVDLAKRSKRLSESHFIANSLPVENHQFVVMDVFDYMKYAKKKGLQYDMIILDPPSFARNKKQTFSVAKDYHQLIHHSLELLNPKGIIVASTNASNLSIEKFQKQIEKGFNGRKHHYLQTNRLPSDFVFNKNDESSNYLKVFTIQVE